MNKYIAIVVCVILGGCVLKNNDVLEKSQQEEVQRAVAMRVVEMYEPVRAITFGNMKKSNAAGGWHGEIVVNDKDRIYVSFSYSQADKKLQMVHQFVDKETLSYRNKEENVDTLEDVSIVYGELE